MKQRARLAGGYGLVEFVVNKMPEVEKKPLRDAPLTDKNIHVISITRDHEVIQNPRGDEVIRKGDLLLCYGALHELRNFANRSKRKKKAKKKPSE